LKSRNHIPGRRLALMAFVVLAGLTTAHAADTSSYPDHAIKLLVPYPPGGTTDIAGRALGDVMQRELKQPIVVENRSGAGGSIGMGVVAHAKPDGYTLGLGTIGTQSINQFLYKDMGYDPSTAFDPLALVITTPNVIAVRADSEIKTLGDLIKAAKKAVANHHKLSYASPGVGSSVHLTGEYFQEEAGIVLLHVPYKGASESIPAVIGGQVDILFDNLPSALSQIQGGGKLRAIAVTSPRRSPALPDVPTVAESGVPGFDVVAWFGLSAPAGTPQAVEDKLIAAAKAALATSELKDKFLQVGAEPGDLFGKDFAKFEEAQRKRWSTLIENRHIVRE